MKKITLSPVVGLNMTTISVAVVAILTVVALYGTIGSVGSVGSVVECGSVAEGFEAYAKRDSGGSGASDSIIIYGHEKKIEKIKKEACRQDDYAALKTEVDALSKKLVQIKHMNNALDKQNDSMSKVMGTKGTKGSMG